MKKIEKKIYVQQKKRFLKKIIGTAEKPRLSVFRSHKHIYAQLINDKASSTLAFSSTLDFKEKVENVENLATIKASILVGQNLAEKAKTMNIKSVVFDRGKKPYHGRIKGVAEGARSVGLIF
jgi:large subunit ribosomal protein L18